MCLFQERSAGEETEVRVRLGNLRVNGYMYIPGVPRVCEKPAERSRKYESLRSKQGDMLVHVAGWKGIEMLAGVQRTVITPQLTTARRDHSGG